MWAHAINAILGVWLMASPEVLGFGNPVADNAHIIGPVIVTFAVVAWWECTRVVGKYNLALGAWLLIAPWILGYDHNFAIVNDMATGALVIAFSLVKGKIKHSYGGGWSALWQKDTLHHREARKQVE
ncbi:MAG: SPW repeat protein [Bacteroidia bacterium]